MYDRRVARDRIPPGAIVETAITLIDRQGFEALSLSAVAAVIGVSTVGAVRPRRQPRRLRDRLAVVATNHLTGAVGERRWGVAGPDALDAIGHAYRGFAPATPASTRRSCARPMSNADLVVADRALRDVFQGCTGASASTPTPPTSPLAAPAARSMASFARAATGSTPGHDDRYSHLLRLLHRGLDRTRP